MKDKILFFGAGDSASPKFWSNVPYFFSNTLENKGYNVIRVDYSVSPIIQKIYIRIALLFASLFGFDNVRPPGKSLMFRLYYNCVIKKYVKKHSDAYVCIFMGSGFYNKWNNVPSIIFDDTPHEWFIRKKLLREPRFFEKRHINYENQAICNSCLAISLFSIPYAYLKSRFPQANVVYNENNVINLFYKGMLNADDIIKKKKQSKNILFIGGGHYIEEAKLLISAFELIHENDPQTHLDIIGIPPEAFEEKPAGVTAHGYLLRSNPVECAKYYELLSNARIYCNPTAKWGAYSSCVESLFFYTPCVISAYDEFVNQFGSDIHFGNYIKDKDRLSLFNALKYILYGDDYENMARQAHEAVKVFTWDNYIDWVMTNFKRFNS